MSEIEFEVTYQGYPVQKCIVERKPGVTTDFGWIELAMEDVKKIAVKDYFRLWESAQQPEVAGPIMAAVAKGIKHPTVAVPVPPDIKGKGLDRSGDLIMKTLIDRKLAGPPVVIHNLFVAPGGIEEQNPDQAEALLHEEGNVRVNVVDFRHFWKEQGAPVWGRYNVLLDNGQFDELTTDGGKPYSAADIFKMIALSLPGAPVIHPKSDVFDPALKEPVNLDMKMDPPVEWLKKLLDVYDLECHLTFDGEIYLKRRGRKHEPRRFRESPGGDAKPLPEVILPDNPLEEKKSVFIIDRPEAVMVVGSRRHRRVTVGLIPVFIDEDEKVRRMEDLPQLWSYSLEEAFVQAFVKHEKNYLDVPSGGDSARLFRRQKIADRDFFKLWAPPWMFEEGVDQIPGAEPNEVGIFWPLERKAHPLLPMLDPWFLPSEIQDLPESRIQFPKQRPVNPKSKALVQTDIVIRASTIDETHFTDLQAFNRYSTKFFEKQKEAIQRLQDERERKKAELQRLLQLQRDDFAEIGTGVENLNVVLAASADTVLEALNVLRHVFFKVETNRDKTKNFELIRRINNNIHRFEIQFIEEQLKVLKESESKIRANLQAAEKDMRDFGFARCFMNSPWGIVSPHRYSIQRDRGLVRFHEVIGVMAAPMTYDLENTELAAIGLIEMTYDVERNTPAPTDQTTFTFMGDPDSPPNEPPSTIKAVRISDFTLLKPRIVEERALVLYDDENGFSMNAAQEFGKAARLARAILDVPRQQDGFAYRYPGLWKVTTDEEINQVSWEFDGDKGITHIVANNPDVDSGSASLERKRRAEELLYGRK